MPFCKFDNLMGEQASLLRPMRGFADKTSRVDAHYLWLTSVVHTYL